MRDPTAFFAGPCRTMNALAVVLSSVRVTPGDGALLSSLRSGAEDVERAARQFEREVLALAATAPRVFQVEELAQAFLGTRIGCARCHNHPLERYTQDDFYHFAAFFSRVKLDRQEPKKGPTTLRLAGTGGKEPHLTKEKVGVRQPRTNDFLAPRPLDRSDVGVINPVGDDPRVPLVKWITDPKNEYFTGSMVNRLWKHYLGVGLVEPVDDLRASNPPSNPELWKALNAEFVK